MRLLFRCLAPIVLITALASLESPAQTVPEPSAPAWATLSPDDLRQSTYDLFAKHGRPFTEPQWVRHYGNLSWYKPDPAYRDDRLDDPERMSLRGMLTQRLRLSRPGERIDRPLFQVERDLLTSGKGVDWGPLARLGVVNGLCIVLFILWRKARIPTLIGFMATSVMLFRGYQAISSVRSDVDVDTAYLLQGPITALSSRGKATMLTVGEQAYAYKGRFPFRIGEVVTLAVSASGTVLQVNGNRAPVSTD